MIYYKAKYYITADLVVTKHTYKIRLQNVYGGTHKLAKRSPVGYPRKGCKVSRGTGSSTSLLGQQSTPNLHQ